jgi:polypeptide N-acetylgalactosaminyltransferase
VRHAEHYDFGEPLELHIKSQFGDKVKLYRNDRNLGLIQSRLKGIRLSTGDVFVLMDSHSEVQPIWLEPLLFEIKKDRKTLANSYIDWMKKKDDGWHYEYTMTTWTIYFMWELAFGWQLMSDEVITRRNLTDPIRERAMIGAYALMDKTFFEEIGAFDEGMEFWGGENIDLPLRTWLFGGQVVSVPCSRVAHLEAPGFRDYRANFTKYTERNYKRVVEVWFDDYKKYFYLSKPTALEIDAGDLTSRFEVKKRALHNFDWFLKNVSPELGMFDVDTFAWGPLKNEGSELCIDMNAELTLYYCSTTSFLHQLFFWSTNFELRIDMNIVMSSTAGASDARYPHIVGYVANYGNDRGTKWIHWKGGPIVDYESMQCLEAVTVGKYRVIIRPCHYGPSQLWTFRNYSSTHYMDLLLHGSSRYPNITQFLNTTMKQIIPIHRVGKNNE